MTAGDTTSARAGTAITTARSSSNTTRLVAGAESGLLPPDLFPAALLTGNGSVLVTHGTNGFEFLLARLAHIFIDGHER